MDPAAREALLDLLLDLQHDLGKYLRMPVAFLPADAGPEDVKEALNKALFATRQGPTGTRSARDLWEVFLTEAGAAVREAESFAGLERAVGVALAWEKRRHDKELDRAEVEHDLSLVHAAIRAVIEELEDAT